MRRVDTATTQDDRRNVKAGRPAHDKLGLAREAPCASNDCVPAIIRRTAPSQPVLPPARAGMGFMITIKKPKGDQNTYKVGQI